MTGRSSRLPLSWVGATVAVGLVACPFAGARGSPREARGESLALAGSAAGTTRDVFFVSKSENRNQVHYGIRLDAACAPAGPAPMFAYWRMLERGPLATEPLLPREVPAYGLASQRVERGAATAGEAQARTGRATAGARVIVRLNALPARAIVVESALGPGGCVTIARTPIAGVSASLASVFVQLRWPFGVDYLLLVGRSSADGRVLRERVRP